MSFFTILQEAIFPDRCVGCNARGSLLCSSCLKKLPPAAAPEHAFVRSVYSYNDFRVKRLVHLLKYKNARHAAGLFAPALAAELTEFLGEEQLFLGARRVLLVPIPLSKKRRARRGYNQSELIARSVCALLPKGAARVETGILKKIVETVPQADIKKRSVRLRNLADCYEASLGEYRGSETIVLVDDVTTTGATLAAARSALRAAGFRKIHAITAAH